MPVNDNAPISTGQPEPARGPALTFGWECPRCHTCWAPHIPKCSNCAPARTGLGVPAPRPIRLGRRHLEPGDIL